MSDQQAAEMLSQLGAIREDIGEIKARLTALESPGRRAGAAGGTAAAALLVGLVEAVKAFTK